MVGLKGFERTGNDHRHRALHVKLRGLASNTLTADYRKREVLRFGIGEKVL